eukprot:2122212-Pleurochrysis_carterae.AAC.1
MGRQLVYSLAYLLPFPACPTSSTGNGNDFAEDQVPDGRGSCSLLRIGSDTAAWVQFHLLAVTKCLARTRRRYLAEVTPPTEARSRATAPGRPGRLLVLKILLCGACEPDHGARDLRHKIATRDYDEVCLRSNGWWGTSHPPQIIVSADREGCRAYPELQPMISPYSTVLRDPAESEAAASASSSLRHRPSAARQLMHKPQSEPGFKIVLKAVRTILQNGRPFCRIVIRFTILQNGKMASPILDYAGEWPNVKKNDST